MFWIDVIRLIIWLTFLLLVVEGIAALIWSRRFLAFYLRKHKELEVEIDAIKRRLHLLEGPHL